MTPLDRVLEALRDAGCEPRRNGTGWAARCPAHEDRNPSLSVGEGQESCALVTCHAGCELVVILDHLKLDMADLFADSKRGPDEEWTPYGPAVAVYDYVDEAGKLLFQVCRTADKQFPQRRPDPSKKSGWAWKLGECRRVLYRLPKVLAAVGDGRELLIVEGEKDVHAVEAAGHVATCNPGGAGKWRPEYAENLRDALVVVVADADDAGRKHARQVAGALRGVASQVRIAEPAVGKDVSDHLAAGHTIEELVVAPPDASGHGGLLEIITAAELVERVRQMADAQWLAAGVWPADAYGVLAAEWKAGKTWADLDLTVSVASGTDWLGVFPIERQGPVLVFLGEGGPRKMERRLQAICESRGLKLADLPIHLCFRSPHLRDGAQLAEIAGFLAAVPAVLVIVDPLYLAARGAKSSALYEMGETLEDIQHVTQAAGAALLVATHHNRNHTVSGSQRITGAGPAEWGRVLINVTVRSKRTDPETKASIVFLEVTFEGDELADEQMLIRRRVWADDPDRLDSALHYEVEKVDDAPVDGGGHPELTPATRRILSVLDAATDWLTVKQIGDRVADGGWPLKERTIQTGLATLKSVGLAVSFGTDGQAYSWRSAARAAQENPCAEEHPA